MPEMDGATSALKEIRKINPTIPAVAFTAAVYDNMQDDLLRKDLPILFISHLGPRLHSKISLFSFCASRFCRTEVGGKRVDFLLSSLFFSVNVYTVWAIYILATLSTQSPKKGENCHAYSFFSSKFSIVFTRLRVFSPGFVSCIPVQVYSIVQY